MNTKLYLVDNGFTNEGCILYAMDPVTFGLSKLGPILDESWTVNGLASFEGNLYGWASKSNENKSSLLHINKKTGKGEVISDINFGPITSLTFDQTGFIFAIAGEAGSLALIRAGSAYGTYTKIADIDPSIQSIGGLIFDSVGNLYALANVKNASATNNNGTYLSKVDTSTGVVNIGSGMKFSENKEIKDINCIAYCDFSLFGGTSLSNIYNLKAPSGKATLVGQPDSSTDFLLYGMTACS